MKPYTIIVYSDQNEIKVFIDDVGSIDNVKMIEKDGELYLSMSDLANLLNLEKDEVECLGVYTYRKV